MIKIIADPKNSSEFLVSTTPNKIRVIADSEDRKSSDSTKIRIFADLQVHSKHSRATSTNLSLENLEKWGRIKGLNLIGTGDFQHPLHRKDIDNYLTEDEDGILYGKNGMAFLWQTEVSLMFSQGGKRRAVHLLVFSPNKNVSDKITSYLSSKGRLDYDGRPIFGITCRDFVRDIKKIDEMIEIIPAHCMTPWFGIFGSDSGFDSLEECFLEETQKIFAVESGMSADPGMLWRLKENVNIVSFSDAHSFWPWRLGREATIFEFEKLSYENIIKVIRTGEGLVGTIETPPEYGKYHWDGHRNCNFSCSPKESKKLNDICPNCGKGLTIGVENRIEFLAKEKEGFVPKNSKIFYKILPLHELIALHLESTLESKKSWLLYNEMVSYFENEFKILLESSRSDFIKNKIDEKLIELVLLNREGKLKVKPGFDGEYGKVLLPEKQMKLF